MKKILVLLAAALCLVLTGCNKNSYSQQRKAENKLIENFISRNNINVLTTEPADDYVWAENDYLLVPGYDNLYFHLISRGDSVRIDSISPTENDTVDLSIIANDVIVARYKKFALTENADTLSYWTTLDQAYPTEFHYGNLNECDAVAWHLAVKLMKYPESQCQIIVPSKLGFSDDQTSVTPYVYILKIKVKQ